MKITLEPIILDNATSMNATFNGNQLESIGYFGVGIQLNVVVATALTGSFKVQHSNDLINWFTSNILQPITLSAVAVNTSYGFTGVPGIPSESQMIPWKYSRIVWTRTSGTGSVTSLVTGVRV